MITLRKILLFKSIYIILFIISLLYLLIYLNINYHPILKEGDIKLTGEVVDIKYQGNKITLVIESIEKLIATYYFNTKEQLNVSKKNLSIGDTIYLEGTINNIISSQNFNGFSYKTYLKYQKIYHTMKIDKYSLKRKNSNILNTIRNSIRQIDNSNKINNYISVFFIGDDTNFDVKLKEKFQKLGISHLFALSGTQISFIIGILNLYKKNNYSFVKFIFIYTILLSYYLLIENCAAIDRAIVFSFIFYLNKTFDFNIKPLFLILLSLSILIFINPYYIYDIGFQYSTVISIVLILYMNNRKSKNKIIELLKISWVSFLVSLPISLYHFSYINPLSIIYNLFYVPFINIIIFPLSMISFITPIFKSVLLFFINIFEFSVNLLSNINFSYIVLARVNIIYYFIYALIIFCYLFFNKKRYLLILIILLLLHYSYPKVINEDALYMIDVGQGDCFLFVSNNKTLLLDTGGVMEYYTEDWMKYEKTSKGKYVVTFLNQLGITKLNYLVLTHGDYDHAGEALTIMNDIKVDNVFFNSNSLNKLEKKIFSNTSNPYKLREGDSFKLGNFNFLTISNTYIDENDSSIVLYITINNKKLLFMGDASIKSEKYILDNYNINDIDILKVGHHGSKTSSSKEFIDEVNPNYSLISVGINNKFNHPNDEVLTRLKNSIIYRTDINGSVMFKFIGNKLDVKSYLQ